MSERKRYPYAARRPGLLIALVWLIAACASSEPVELVPPPASTAGTTVVAGPAPAETRDPYTTFTLTLKNAIEQNDDPALKPLVGTPWLSGRFKTELTEYREAEDAVTAFRALRLRATVTVDTTLAGKQPSGAPQPGDRILVARWLNSNGTEEPAYLYASFSNGGWHWTGLLIGVPAELVSAQPTATPAVLAPPPTTAATVVASVGTATAIATTAPAGTTSPATTQPTGSGQLAFAQGGKLAVRDLKGTPAAPALPLPASILWGEWSRDGLQGVFLTGSAERSEMWLVRADGGGLKRIGEPARYATPRWSPDGTTILYTLNSSSTAGRSEIWSINPDGTGRRKLIDGFDAVWSPDGQRIAFASNPTVLSGERPARNGIHLVNAQGKNEWAPISTDTPSPKFTPLEWQMNLARLVDSPHWSPDGKELTLRVQNGHGAYVTTGSTSGGFGKFLAVYFDGSAHGFSYSPNGVYIALGSGGQSGFTTVNIVRRSDIGKDGVSGTPLRTLGRTPSASGEKGQNVSDYAWSPDGTRIAYALENGGVWLMNIDSGAAAQISSDGAAPVYWLQ